MSRKNMGDMVKLVPELLVSDFVQSLKFYTEVLRFKQLYDRTEEAFAYLNRDGAQIMIVQHEAGDERSWIAGELVQPFGRGMNLEIEVEDVDALHASCAGSPRRAHFPGHGREVVPARCVAAWGAPVYCAGPGWLSYNLAQSLGTRPASGEV